jgi:hypothetical protein
MALLTRASVAFVALSLGCAPFDIELFEREEVVESSGGTGGVGAGPVIVDLVGGTSGLMGGTGGGGDPIETLVDDFEDGDTKALDPAGWWYTVNDGTGVQTLSVAEAWVDPERGLVLETTTADFTGWGAAFGVDVGSYEFPLGGLEVSFFVVSSREVQVSFHALDASGDHFTTDFSVDGNWREVTVRLDRSFIVDDLGVRSLDLTSLHELQWFLFDGVSTASSPPPFQAGVGTPTALSTVQSMRWEKPPAPFTPAMFAELPESTKDCPSLKYPAPPAITMGRSPVVCPCPWENSFVKRTTVLSRSVLPPASG